MSDEYLCLTVVSRPGEGEAAFKSRLSDFWTLMLRQFPAEFEQVYAETTAFESDGDCLSRQYLIAEPAVALVARELRTAGLDHEPIERDEVYSKYEAQPPEWMWIEH